jgi:hypothetical protein
LDFNGQFLSSSFNVDKNIDAGLGLDEYIDLELTTDESDENILWTLTKISEGIPSTQISEGITSAYEFYNLNSNYQMGSSPGN